MGLQSSYHDLCDARFFATVMGDKMADDEEGPTTRIKRYRATHKRVEIITIVLIIAVWGIIVAYLQFIE